MLLSELVADSRYIDYVSQYQIYEHPCELGRPWEHIACYAVGGLRSVGFAKDSDLLVVTSSDGTGVFDCLSGEKLARDTEVEPNYEDEVALRARGIGPLKGIEVAMSGLHGGGLPLATLDGWFLVRTIVNRDLSLITLRPPSEPGSRVRDYFVLATEEEVRAFGFSYTGMSFVIAEGSHTLEIYRRIQRQF